MIAKRLMLGLTTSLVLSSTALSQAQHKATPVVATTVRVPQQEIERNFEALLASTEAESVSVKSKVKETAINLTAAQGDPASKYLDPNKIPYRTRKSPLVQFFSLPAKIWHLFWSPLGAAIIWVERNRIPEKAINFFMNDDRTAGFFPLVSFGGNIGTGVGIAAFHNNLFNKRKKVNFSFLFNSFDNNFATLAYSDSSLFGGPLYFNLQADFLNDEDQNLFISDKLSPEDLENTSIKGNQTTGEDETSYSTKQGGAAINLGYLFSRKVGLGITAAIKRTNIDKGGGRRGEKFPLTVPGTGTASFFSIGSTLTLNFRNGWPRTLSGTLLRFIFQYTRELNGSQFEFRQYAVEAQQFISLPFLAKNRRLAVRSILERVDPTNNKKIPFYELSLLGDASNLRGFDQNRFRGKGSLLFNFEYRYPVWDTWDAVIFLDEGQVFDDFSELNIGDFHWAAGFGLRVMMATGFVFRFEIGFSREPIYGRCSKLSLIISLKIQLPERKSRCATFSQ
ncbi:MAG: BamA/TamA family outer membrane protein, partial [bacterium]